MNEHRSITSLRPLVLSAVFAALVAAGGFIRFDLPFSPVPITLQTFFVLLAGLFLSPRWALASMALYLAAGLAGLPVFAGGSRGLTVLLGPSGGFLLGFLVAAPSVSLLRNLPLPRPVLSDFLALLAGTLIIYAIGYPWIVLNLGWEWRVGLVRAVLPYLPGDIVKLLVSLLLAAPGRRILERHA